MIALEQHPPTAKEWRFSILIFFIFIGLLRLTNFNFYLSQLVGFETKINATGGDAFNFINYFAIIGLGFLILGYWRWSALNWKSTWPMICLVMIYITSALMSPYTNFTWVVYQLLFILVAIFLHLHTIQQSSFLQTIAAKKALSIIYLGGLGFVLFCAIQILSQVSFNNYIAEFNDSFVQSLDDYGIMKQRYGYFLGFLLAYTLFVIKSPTTKLVALMIIFSTGFGIRSFILGALGGGLIFVMRQPKRLVLTGLVITPIIIWLIGQYFQQGIYDTRFYPYLNAFDIVQKFPFGVGLGGYPAYTEEFSRQLLANFYDVNSVLDFVPIAPESDIVHLFGSLGWPLALLHFLIIARMIWLIIKKQFVMSSIEKSICFYFAFMCFFGISEDSIFSINYWIFFGICSGIVTRLSLNNQPC